MLHYYPRHASSINKLIFRRTNCILTASGSVALELSERTCILLVYPKAEGCVFCSLTSWVSTFHFYVGISWCYLVYEIIIIPLLGFHRLAHSLCACGALSFALREENILRVFENRVKIRISVPTWRE
jgi:hypothetical protein